jgi:hypothetical protein
MTDIAGIIAEEFNNAVPFAEGKTKEERERLLYQAKERARMRIDALDRAERDEKTEAAQAAARIQWQEFDDAHSALLAEADRLDIETVQLAERRASLLALLEVVRGKVPVKDSLLPAPIGEALHTLVMKSLGTVVPSVSIGEAIRSCAAGISAAKTTHFVTIRADGGAAT